MTLPQIQPGSKTNEAIGSDPAPSPAPLSSPSSDTAKAEAPNSKSVDALPADVPRTPPVPPPPPDVIHREKPSEPTKEVSESVAVIKAIPLPVDPTANPGTPSTAPADQPDKKEQESHSDRAVAAMVAKIGASFNPLESNTMPLTNAPIPEVAEDTVPADAVSAQKAAKAFLAASSWSERLKWSQRPEAIKSAMEKHYA